MVKDHFVMVIWVWTRERERERERDVLVRLYGIRHMVKDQSNSERKPAAAT